MFEQVSNVFSDAKKGFVHSNHTVLNLAPRTLSLYPELHS